MILPPPQASYRPLLRLGRAALVSLCLALLPLRVHPTQAPVQQPAENLPAQKSPAKQLEPGKPIEKELAGGATDTYEIQLKKGQFLHVVAEQKGIDVVLMLVDPIGRVLVDADSPNGAWGPEPASVIAAENGTYQVEVKSLDTNAVAGKYRITVMELREAKPQDETRIEAERTLFEAVKAGDQQSSESLQKTLELYQRSVSLWHVVGDPYEEALCLRALGEFRKRSGGTDDVRQALEYYKQAADIMHANGDKRNEGETLVDIADAYVSLGDREIALQYFQLALPLEVALGDIRNEAVIESNIGFVYAALGQSSKAIERFERALPLERTIADNKNEATTLGNIAEIYRVQGEAQNALDYFGQELAVRQRIGDTPGEASVLQAIGAVHQAKGEYREALEYCNRALMLNRKLGDRGKQAANLANIGTIHGALGEVQKALEYYDQALALGDDARDKVTDAGILLNQCRVYYMLADERKALGFCDKAVTVGQASGDRVIESAALVNRGTVLGDLGEPQKAIEDFQRALQLQRKAGDRRGEAAALRSLAEIQEDLGEKQKALNFYNEALVLQRAVEDSAGEAVTLNKIGRLELLFGEKQKAIEHYQKALILARSVQVPLEEAMTLSNVMTYWKNEKNRTLAILFGKQAVNTYQEIRRNILGLEADLQKDFLESKADTYRELGDLLIGEGRLAEAQQVLDLLKEEEYFEFVRGEERSAEAKNRPVVLNPEEQSSHDAYEKIAGQITALGREYAELRPKRERTAEEEAHLSEVNEKLTLANQEMERFFKMLYVEFGKNAQANQSAENVREQTSGMQSLVRELGPGTVALYTLVGESRYRVIVITATTMQAREYPIAAADLRKKVAAFLEALKNPASDPLPASQELYKILFAPIAGDLKGAKAQTLMWSLNDVLRYVPMAALYDGKQFLVENYRNVVITPASIGRLKDKVDVSGSTIAGMGVSKDYDGLGALAAVPEELKHIVRDAQVQGATGVIPGTMLLDDDFTETRMASALDKHYPVVHIASHFVLQAGNETNSYLLLGGKDVGGKGYHLTLAELRDDPALTFDGTELLTLSACQTGASGTALNGREVDGLGITAQQKGAKAVLASLWSVADESTALLMADFYKHWLGTPGMTKAGALQQAQLDMLHGTTGPEGAGATTDKTKSSASEKNSAVGASSAKDSNDTKAAASYAHPFYWAPFILIGNWR